MKLALRKHNYKGRLLVFEGTDGAGKTTMLDMAEQYLADRLGQERLLRVKQPTDISRKTRLFQKMMYCCSHAEIDYRAVQLLTMSDRLQHQHEVIAPALAAGKIVLCDRYVFTSVANMLSRGYKRERWFFQVAQNILRPDFAFLAYAEPYKAIARIKARPEECNRHLNEPLLRRVAAQFLSMQKQAHFIVLPTGGDSKSAFHLVEKHLQKIGEATA